MESILKTVRWKVTVCPTGDDCWCRMIEPVEPIIDEKGYEWDNVVGAAQIGKDLAEHIVGLHNNYMDNLIPSPYTVYSDEEKERLNNLLTKKMEQLNEPPYCDGDNPNMLKSVDLEGEGEMIDSKTRKSKLCAAAEKLGIPKKYFGRK